MALAAIFLEVNVLFPDLTASIECIEHLASQLSRTDALFWCARANLVLSNQFNTGAVSEDYLLHTFFPERDEWERARTWVRDNAASGGTVFFRAQFLELAYWVAKFSRDLPNDGRTFESHGARRIFGQAALAAAGLWSNRVNEAVATGGGLDVSELRKRVMVGVRASMDENARGALPYVAVGRGALLWEKYMPKQSPQSNAAFEGACGMTREDYFRSFAALTSQHLDIRPERITAHSGSAGLFKVDVWDQKDAMRTAFRRLLSGLTTPVERLRQLAGAGDHAGFLRQLRRQPVMCTPDGRHIVMDPPFLIAQAILGPLFAISATRPQHDYQSFVDFGAAFEDYVADCVFRAS